ncbi:D-aminoacyl-tRNA deacylase [Hippea maritima]|uniref:D-aminoacyl-tRNA deacylase n=1 Tax=Hippea maritima (strain ATCC 700847 / DSM 10411 / MH2) TaxID=760142 RepID=F2LX30_HIPMA|nr:D-aminoacyl-tRNA deacylase [Hippea maritima]AEA33088.1 D-tyrosyl-tRNA(Tyr) deacylase [Hippea maritima DSM 10411]
MRAVIQRVKQASVVVDGKVVASIETGILILLCVCKDDTQKDIEYLAKKIANMRIFSDENGKFNLSVKDMGGSCIVVSQFTLAADTKKGNRPSYFYAAEPQKAQKLYNEFVRLLKTEHNLPTQKGVFAAHMDVKLINDGPVTIYIDSKENLQ